MKKIGIYAILLISILSCNTDNNSSNEFGEYFEKIFHNHEGHIRGITIGDTIQKVKGLETCNLTDESSDYLYYDTDINETDHYNIEYYFDETGLFEMRFDINILNKEDNKKLLSDLSNYLTNKFGESSIIDSFTIWKTQTSSSKKIEIALSGESVEDGLSWLTLSVTNYDY